MIRRLTIALSLLLCGISTPIFATAQTSETFTSQDSFTRFDYQGYTMSVPAGVQIDITGKEAILKSDDGTFGMSLKVEADKGASQSKALEMCRRMVTDLDVKNAQISRVSIHGLNGARLEGITEGAPISMLILAAHHQYLKMVIINTPEHTSWASVTMDSLSLTDR